MKKIITIAFAVVLTMFGASPSFAQTAEDCVESDNITDPDLAALCADVAAQVDDDAYPAVAGEGGEIPPVTTAAPTTAPTPTTAAPVVAADRDPVPARQGTLPATGGSGSSGLLQGGALMLVAGAVIFVLARRRSTAPAA
jgi:LPXTG-motif cell wall-anchored protein